MNRIDDPTLIDPFGPLINLRANGNLDPLRASLLDGELLIREATEAHRGRMGTPPPHHHPRRRRTRQWNVTFEFDVNVGRRLLGGRGSAAEHVLGQTMPITIIRE